MKSKLFAYLIILLLLMCSCTMEPKVNNCYVPTISFTYNGQKYTNSALLVSFNEGLAAVVVENKYGYIDENYQVIIEPKFDSARNFKDGVAIVSINDKFGFIDKSGEFVIKPKYDSAKQFKLEVSLVSLDGKFGFINKTGELVTPIHFEWAEEFNHHLARVMLDREFFYINKTGEKTFSHTDLLTEQDRDPEDIFPTPKQYPIGYTGFVNSNNKYVIDTLFDRACHFSCGWALVKLEPGIGLSAPRYTYIDTSGKALMPPILMDAKPFSEDLAAVKFDKLWGYINTSGEIVIQPEFAIVRDFHEGLASASSQAGHGNAGFIDSTGEFVIPPTFYSTMDFHEGLAVVRNEKGKYGFIDKSGKIVIEPQYGHAYDFFEGIANCMIDKFPRDKANWIFIDSNGNQLPEPDQEWFARRSKFYSLPCI